MLAIVIRTEPGESHERVSAEGLAGLVRRVGGRKDRFLVLERLPDEPDFYAQVWHEDEGSYQVEYRDGSARRHFQAHTDDADAVAAALTGWARRTPGSGRRADMESPRPRGTGRPGGLRAARGGSRAARGGSRAARGGSRTGLGGLWHRIKSLPHRTTRPPRPSFPPGTSPNWRVSSASPCTAATATPRPSPNSPRSISSPTTAAP
ncbi:hypothetical protein GA0115246_1125616 [Streptomyces sp. SolWspMP-sol7th]|nr:hypothetical protein GA0115246_1125616 [Streptomyces sp. SolWspMP-sol7th]